MIEPAFSNSLPIAMKLLIQSDDKGIPLHEFGYHAMKAVEYQKWAGGDFSCEMSTSPISHGPDVVPVGSIEFVHEFLEKYHAVTPKPLNVPVELFPFAGRKILNGTENDIWGECFVKSNDVLKLFTDICESAPKGNYQISEVVDIVSEYRCFVYRGANLGCFNYSGNFSVYPDMNTVYEMIRAYKSAPIAYTLDIAVQSCGITVPVEVHNFYSCGLYGFSDYQKYPYMLVRWIMEFLNSQKRKP